MKNIKQESGTSTSNQRDEDNKQSAQRPIAVFAAEIMAKFKPPGFPFAELTTYLYGWKKSSNFVLSGENSSAVSDLALAFGENFATHAGPVIWIGCHSEISTIYERLLSRDARVERKGDATYSLLDDSGKIALTRAAMRIDTLPLNLIDIDQYSDEKSVQEFLNDVQSSAPTLILIEPELFIELKTDQIQFTDRRTNLFELLDWLNETNPDNRILWHLPLSSKSARTEIETPSIDDLVETTLVKNSDVVMFVQSQKSDTPIDAELIIVKNKFGSLGAIPLQYDQKYSTWLERTVN